MKVSKQRMVYGAMLGLGLIALAVDRFVLSPGTAEASDEPAALLVHNAPVAVAVAAKPAVAAPQGDPVVEKLKTLSDSLKLSAAPVKDAFTAAPAWGGKGGSTVADPRTFEQSHQLTGVMVSGRRPSAMIDGTLVMVGQTIDGFKLVSVAPGAAAFQCNDMKVTLRSR